MGKGSVARQARIACLDTSAADFWSRRVLGRLEHVGHAQQPCAPSQHTARSGQMEHPLEPCMNALYKGTPFRQVAITEIACLWWADCHGYHYLI